MTTLAMTLDQAVRGMCPQVANRVTDSATRKLGEPALWAELACCVLSSQVRYETAVAATRKLKAARIFGEIYDDVSDRRLRLRVREILEAPLRVDGNLIRYRFPRSRAVQLVQTRNNLMTNNLTLSEIVYGKRHETEKRRQLVKLVCGFGPKQSSMFLRACGVSYELAILDRHALSFMRMMNLVDEDGPYLAMTMTRYESLEGRFGNYAKQIGYPVGYVDWAVWLVMRALLSMRK